MDINSTLKFLELLETNEDKLRGDLFLTSQSDLNKSFEFTNVSCHICNGYYGPSFGEPVCLTCHAFLYPDYATFLPASVINSEKTDDGDSGNDEPSDLNYTAEKKTNHSQNNVALWMLQNQGENDQENDKAEERYEAFRNAGGSGIIPPNHPPQVEHRLEMLSNARPNDHMEAGLVQRLPPEVLLWIFSYLDDLSLCSVSMVCHQWRDLLKAHIPVNSWAKFINKRWPLFKSLLNNNDYFKTYQKLMTSCFCYTCLLQMAVQLQPVGEENSWRRNRLRTEIKVLHNDPPEGIAAIPLDVKCCHWQATITGPIGSPYEGGLFYLYIQVPYSYPMNPPVVRFLTKILHPNISRHGDVGIDCIHHNWSLALTISKVLISIQSLLTDPYTNICMEPEIGHLYNTDRKTFEHLARQWTWKYAMNDILFHRTDFK